MQARVEFRHKSFLFLDKENKNSGGYTAFVTNLEVVDPNSEKLTIVGKHLGTENDRSVVGITIQNQTHIQKFPRGFGEHYPNLKYFEIANSSITMLRREDLLDLGHLQGLWMPRNPIVSLPNDLFMNVQGLRFLSFHKNKLKYVGADILKPLKNLQKANFSENTTIDMNFIGGEEQLAALNKEIAQKCLAPKAVNGKAGGDSSLVTDLSQRFILLEAKVKRLEKENEEQAAKFAQSQSLVKALQLRVEVLEQVLQ